MATCLQQQTEWISDCIRYMQARGLDVCEASREAEDRWIAHHEALAADSLLTKINSWYMGSNVEEKPRRLLSYVGGVGRVPAEMRRGRRRRICGICDAVTGPAGRRDAQAASPGRGGFASGRCSDRRKVLNRTQEDRCAAVLRPPRREITTRMLMLHTAGFGYDVFNEDYRRLSAGHGLPQHRDGDPSVDNRPLALRARHALE